MRFDGAPFGGGERVQERNQCGVGYHHGSTPAKKCFSKAAKAAKAASRNPSIAAFAAFACLKKHFFTPLLPDKRYKSPARDLLLFAQSCLLPVVYRNYSAPVAYTLPRGNSSCRPDEAFSVFQCGLDCADPAPNSHRGENRPRSRIRACRWR